MIDLLLKKDRARGVEIYMLDVTRILDAATSLGDLAALNSNRLEALKGKP
ncbi:MAG TPA: hypothetical protein VGG97_04630 [Bryobacteraceae bacterium]